MTQEDTADKSLVALGAWYRHCVSGSIMRCYEADLSGDDNTVKLIDPSAYGIWTGFVRKCEGTYRQFVCEWVRCTVQGDNIATLQVRKNGRWVDLYVIDDSKAESGWSTTLNEPATELRVKYSAGY